VKKHQILSRRPSQEPGSKGNLAKSEKDLSSSGITTWPEGTKTFKPDKDLKTIRHQGLYYFCQKAAKVSHSKERHQQKLLNLHQEKIEGIRYSKQTSGTQNVKIKQTLQ